MDPEPSASPAIAKAMLRRALREKLRVMSHADHAKASLVICAEAAALPEFRAARAVGLFAPLATEPDLHPLIEEAWAVGKRVALPLVIKSDAGGSRLDWHEVKDWDELIVPGPFGLREPDPARCPRLSPGNLDFVFVPGLAFDRAGKRLGRGGGFYDRFLAGAPKKCGSAGIMFGCQEIALVPSEPHDQPLKSVVTEDGRQVF